MRRSLRSQNAKVELKYCEHCGELWVREAGAGVYCAKCEPMVADLPVPKKRSSRLMLPKQERTVADGIGRGAVEDSLDLEVVGGVA
jgi:hypothetical protein